MNFWWNSSIGIAEITPEEIAVGSLWPIFNKTPGRFSIAIFRRTAEKNSHWFSEIFEGLPKEPRQKFPKTLLTISEGTAEGIDLEIDGIYDGTFGETF